MALIKLDVFNSCIVSGNDFSLVSGNNRDNKPDISGTSPITIRGSPKLQLFCREKSFTLYHKYARINQSSKHCEQEYWIHDVVFN